MNTAFFPIKTFFFFSVIVISPKIFLYIFWLGVPSRYLEAFITIENGILYLLVFLIGYYWWIRFLYVDFMSRETGKLLLYIFHLKKLKKIILYANKDISFQYSQHFSYLIALARISCTMLNINGEKGHLYLFHVFTEKNPRVLLLRIVFAGIFW